MINSLSNPEQSETNPGVEVLTQAWEWRGYHIRYRQAGEVGPAVVLIHGFGASSLHWRHNLGELGQTNRVYALDLIGFGESAKPTPGLEIDYTFPTWAALVLDFMQTVIGEPAFLIGNSIGCVVALQAAVDRPELVRGLGLLNCSLRLLHERKRQTLPFYRQWGATVLQQVLPIKPLGYWFFQQLAKPPVIAKILRQAYANPDRITPDLITALYQPSQDAGAADVFLAFVTYSQGPLPEDLLPLVQCPTLIIWGEADPWEPLALAQAWKELPTVADFITLPGVGHCPQDEAPEQVNPILVTWLAKHDADPLPPRPGRQFSP